MFAKISLPDQKKDNAIVVPNEAVKIENGVKYIYTVEGNKIKKIVVETGIANDKITEITTSIKAGYRNYYRRTKFINNGEK